MVSRLRPGEDWGLMKVMLVSIKVESQRLTSFPISVRRASACSMRVSGVSDVFRGWSGRLGLQHAGFRVVAAVE